MVTVHKCIMKVQKIYVVFLAVVNFANCETHCGPDRPTVAIRKARGRVGNHMWMLMINIAYELKYPGLKTYITEDSRWILDKYFKNYGENEVQTAERDLCGYKEFYDHFELYLNTKIIDFYEEKSGVRLEIMKPEGRPSFIRGIEIPTEIGLKYPLSVPDLIKSAEFQDGFKFKKLKTENCPYEWEIFEGSLEEFESNLKNKAYHCWPSGASPDQFGEFFNVSGLYEALEQNLQLKDEFVDHAQQKLAKIKKQFSKSKSAKKDTIFVGIHSRRTDHLAFQEKKNLIHLDPSYYMDAIEIYRKKFPSKKYNLAFIWVSDDLQWGRDKIGSKKIGKNVFFIGEEQEDKGPYDLALLASCNHTILSHGSFTYFAGFLANGLKIVPQHFQAYRNSQESTLKILKKNPLDFPLPRLHFFDFLE